MYIGSNDVRGLPVVHKTRIPLHGMRVGHEESRRGQNGGPRQLPHHDHFDGQRVYRVRKLDRFLMNVACRAKGRRPGRQLCAVVARRGFVP